MSLLLAAVAPQSGLGLPFDASLDGRHVDAMLHWTLGWTSVLFLVLFGFMAYATWAHDRRQRASTEAGTSRRATVRTLGVALAIFGLIDVALFVTALRDLDRVFWNFDAVDARPDVVRIEVNARQWAWDARYSGPDGEFGTDDDVLALNRIAVPAGAPVLIELAASDVIHSFSVPNLRVKRDAVPGRITALTFTATEPGTYEIACAQLCGVNHYKMRGELVVLPPAEYAAWLARSTAEAKRAYDGDDAPAHWAWNWKARR